jgi:hypothetical protein
MRRVLLIGCAALFISLAGLAQTPSPAPLSQETLAAILGQPAVTGEVTSPQTEEPVVASAKRPLPEKASCTATANCPFGTVVTCQGTTSCTSTDGTSCSAKGHVTCNGVTKSCATCYVNCRCGGFSDAFCRANC